jgi:hypothetical protein
VGGGGISSEGSPGGSNGDAGDASGSGNGGAAAGSAAIAQLPVTLRIVNNTGEVKYLSGDEPVRASYQSDTGNESVMMVPPVCMAKCEEVVDDDCCVMCDLVSHTIAILPGDAVEYPWSGAVYTIDGARCDGCGCYTTSKPLAGSYEIYVDAYTEVRCLGSTEACAPPDASGELEGSDVSGESTSHVTSLNVPSDGEVLSIEISP